MRVAAVVLAGLVLTSMFYAVGLQHMSIERGVESRVVSDSQAVLRPSSDFSGGSYTLSSRFRLVGTVQNAAPQNAQVMLTVDPVVSQACFWLLLFCADVNGTLYICWSPNTSPNNTTDCGSGQSVQFSGYGPQDPSSQVTASTTFPAGATRYVYARLDSFATNFCGQAAFRWQVTYPQLVGSVGGPFSGNPDGSRFQYYRRGSGC